MCQHKRLNPLAVNKFKLVSKEGVELLKKALMLSAAELGVFEATNDDTTRCKQCVLNCFEYLRSKEKIKQDTKILRNLMKAETQYEKNLSTKSNEEILREVTALFFFNEKLRNYL